MNKKILIAGSGLGGLSAALRMASRGYDVTILEKYHKAGGRLNQFSESGFTFDLGPSFMSMTYEFDEFFKDCGMKNPLKMKSLDPLYKVNFRGSSKIYNISKDLDKLSAEFEGVEPDFKRKAEKYLNLAGQFFHDTENTVVKQNFNSLYDYFIKITKVPLKHVPYLNKKLWSLLDETFDSMEVKVIFSLVAFFLGSTPFKTPSIYSLLNYTEFKHNGYWLIEGGMYTIVEEILKALKKFNAEIIYDTEITEVTEHSGKVTGMIDKKGKVWKADYYIINADAASFRGQILKRKKYAIKKLDSMEWSLAPFTIYLGVKGKIKNLYHHNYFLGNNFTEYAKNIFSSSYIPSKPYYYVNMSSYSEASSAPENCENLFILCPVPDLRFKNDWSDKENVAQDIITDLSERINYDINSNIIVKKILTPEDWSEMFGLYKGSGLGLSHKMTQVGGFRPSNKDEVNSNLFYTGASTTPGTGLPMVLISSKMVAERILNEH